MSVLGVLRKEIRAAVREGREGFAKGAKEDIQKVVS
jgi:hypothetical protein